MISFKSAGLVVLVASVLMVSGMSERPRSEHRPPPPPPPPFEPPRPHVPEEMSLNCTAKLVEAIIQSKTVVSGAKDIVYAWDMIPLVPRYFLLAQKSVLSIWNVTEKLLANQTNLTWATIPADVQALILAQQIDLKFLNLSFCDWGFVNESNALANVTLFSLLSPRDLKYVELATKLANQVAYSSALNTTALWAALSADSRMCHGPKPRPPHPHPHPGLFNESSFNESALNRSSLEHGPLERPELIKPALNHHLPMPEFRPPQPLEKPMFNASTFNESSLRPDHHPKPNRPAFETLKHISMHYEWLLIRAGLLKHHPQPPPPPHNDEEDDFVPRFLLPIVD